MSTQDVVGLLYWKSVYFPTSRRKSRKCHLRTVYKLVIFNSFVSWNPTKMFTIEGPRGLPILIPSFCWHIVLSKLNFTRLVAMYISFKKIGSRRGVGLWWLQYRVSVQMAIASSSGTLVYKLAISKEQKIALFGSMYIWCIWCANVNESLMQ